MNQQLIFSIGGLVSTVGLMGLIAGSAHAANPCRLDRDSARFHIQLMSRDKKTFWSAGKGLRFRIEYGNYAPVIELETDEKGCLTVSGDLVNEGATYSLHHRELSWDLGAFETGMGGTLSMFLGIVADIHFHTASARINFNDPHTGEHLRQMLELATTYSGKKILIAGHTDSDGDAGFNRTLSQRRAEALRAYLISKGVDSRLIRAVGYGESRPIASNRTRSGKARNRRIEIEIH